MSLSTPAEIEAATALLDRHHDLLTKARARTSLRTTLQSIDRELGRVEAAMRHLDHLPSDAFVILRTWGPNERGPLVESLAYEAKASGVTADIAAARRLRGRQVGMRQITGEAA